MRPLLRVPDGGSETRLPAGVTELMRRARSSLQRTMGRHASPAQAADRLWLRGSADGRVLVIVDPARRHVYPLERAHPAAGPAVDLPFTPRDVWLSPTRELWALGVRGRTPHLLVSIEQSGFRTTLQAPLVPGGDLGQLTHLLDGRTLSLLVDGPAGSLSLWSTFPGPAGLLRQRRLRWPGNRPPAGRPAIVLHPSGEVIFACVRGEPRLVVLYAANGAILDVRLAAPATGLRPVIEPDGAHLWIDTAGGLARLSSESMRVEQWLPLAPERGGRPRPFGLSPDGGRIAVVSNTARRLVVRSMLDSAALGERDLPFDCAAIGLVDEDTCIVLDAGSRTLYAIRLGI